MDSNMPVTNNSVEQTESMAAPETIETLAPSKELAEKMKPVQQRYNEALETYQNIKGSIYGEPGSNMMAGNAKELGQTKLVPYKSPQQVREKINSAQESITYALDLNRQLANIFEGWINLSASEPNKVNRLKFNVRKLNSEFEKLKADRFELKSEAITVEETMKQRNERFMGGGELAAQLSGLAASSKGTAYGLAGGVSQLNRLMDNQIVMQDQKIAKIQAALSSAESDEEMMALEGQLKHAKIEKELLQNKIFQQTNDALQGKFDPSFYTDAMSSPLVTKTSKTKSKFVLASKYIKESDTEIEDYYNNLYENSEDSPEYGTALEHPKETRYTLTVDIPKHKHKKSSKYNLN
jgi:outer membrane murein-binding lipoprotein Lpp